MSWVWRSDNLDNIGELNDKICMTMMLIAVNGDGYDNDKFNVEGTVMLKLMMIEMVAMIHKTSQLGGCGGAGWPGKG